MINHTLPRYPVYIPSKGRYQNCRTARFLARDSVPFYIVVETQEQDFYVATFGKERVLVLPWQDNDKARQEFTAKLGIENGGLIAARNWIKEHSSNAGYERHWQIDDNIDNIKRRFVRKRMYCDSGVALACIEDFVDRYENIAIAGLNYQMFAPDNQKMPPFLVNVHVYSCTLILNSIPYKWRIAYNDDTDICLQVLSGGWCTVAFNAFVTFKRQTMVVKGGNTTDLYQGDGRLKMARSLERLWPGVVKTGRRFKRPQHIIKDSWKRFDTPLRLKPGIDLSQLEPVNEYGMKLVQVAPEIKSAELRKLLDQ